MRLKMYQIYVVAGLVSAVLFTIFRYREHGSTYTLISSTLEGATVAFSALGAITGGRSIRAQFQALGSDKALARDNPAYMRDRRELQLSLLPAATAFAVLFAARYGLNLLLIWIVVPVALAVAVMLANRVMGWRVKR